jgi:signal transduction histidine kinase
MRRILVQDSAVALAVFGATLALLASLGLGTPSPGTRGLDLVGIVLAGAASLPLAVRRIAPATVYLITATASVTLLGLRYGLDVPLGVSVAVYGMAVAFGGHPSRVRRVAAFTAVAAFVPCVAAVFQATHVVDVRTVPTELLMWLVIVVGLWVAGDRARLRREQIFRERRVAVAEERARIARELHDSAGHAINVILVQAGAARLLQDRNPAGSRAAIETIEQVARDTIGEIDRIVRALRDGEESTVEAPAPTDPVALEELAGKHRASGLDVQTRVDGPRRDLPPSLAWAGYRILQEALTNAARHGTGTADVAVRSAPDAVEITVTNPTALGRPPPGGGGHGIVGMRERAHLLGGTLEAHHGDGVFRLHAWLPDAPGGRTRPAAREAAGGAGSENAVRAAP